MPRNNFGGSEPASDNTGAGTKKRKISVSEVIWVVSGFAVGAVAQIGYYASQEYRANKRK